MNKYGQAALRAVEIMHSNHTLSPINAWNMATTEIFGENTSGQTKGCPRSTFLALCETGRVKGVQSGDFTRSIKNRSYAIKALELLSQNPEMVDKPSKLWSIIQDSTRKSHNEQMNVVLALWTNNLISS